MPVSILGWGRPISDQFPTYHAITHLDLYGAVVTVCFGRWPVSEPQEFHPEPALDVRLAESCERCLEIAYGQQVASFARLIASDDAAVPIPLDDFDLGGEAG